jgi:hypothetical protein
MGTFHHDKGELHGITVVVDTRGPQIWVGRCDTVTDSEIILLDADVHQEGSDGLSKEDFVGKAARFGHWSRHARVAIARDEVSRIQRLGEVGAR